jgi:hypothetical protein
MPMLRRSVPFALAPTVFMRTFESARASAPGKGGGGDEGGPREVVRVGILHRDNDRFVLRRGDDTATEVRSLRVDLGEFVGLRVWLAVDAEGLVSRVEAVASD